MARFPQSDKTKKWDTEVEWQTLDPLDPTLPSSITEPLAQYLMGRKALKKAVEARPLKAGNKWLFSWKKDDSVSIGITQSATKNSVNYFAD